MSTHGVRAYLAREKILALLQDTGRAMSTPEIRQAVCTPRELMFGPRALPESQQIHSTTVYPALMSLARQHKVGRLPKQHTHDPVWWYLLDEDDPRVAEAMAEVEATDLDALLARWRTET